MSIFTKEQMWQVAVNCKSKLHWNYGHVSRTVSLESPEDVEKLYNTLKKAHNQAVELYEKGIV